MGHGRQTDRKEEAAREKGGGHKCAASLPQLPLGRRGGKVK